MSKRAEEYANKQFPYKIKKVGWLQQNEDVNATSRLIAQEAYEQAEKDTIKKVAEYLVRHLGELSQNPDIKYAFVKQFRASMEEK